jgi:peptide/nickel transport system permease protein
VTDVRSALIAALRWAAGGLATVVIASFLIQIALAEAPGDPAAGLAGPKATQAQIEAVREQLGLDRPPLTRYVDWVSAALRGDFGTSVVQKEPVVSLLSSRTDTTVMLVLYTALLVLVVGVGLGVLGGVVRGLSSLVAAFSAVAVAVPAFVTAQILVTLFALRLGWFPATGAGTGVADRLWHLTLPAVALGASWGAYVTQITRTSVQEAGARDHVETALVRGVPYGVVLRRHILRNAALPITTIAALTVAGLVVGTVVVESAFGINGLGSLLVEAISAKDYPVVQAVSVIVVVVFVVVTGLIDLMQRLLGPRRTGGSAR